MDKEPPLAKDLAILVLSHERTDISDIKEFQSVVQRIFERLNSHLSIRLGTGGYHALLYRAVTLAASGSPWLASVHVSQDGLVEGFQDMSQYDAIYNGSVAILAHLIELLDTFIGRILTIRILHNIWPDVIQIDTVGSLGESNG